MGALMWSVPAAVLAQEPEEAAEEEAEDPFRAFHDLVEEAEHVPGFMDLYRTEDKLYLAVPQDMLGEHFLMDYRIARGIGARGLFGGTTPQIFEMDIMALEQRGPKVFLEKQPHRFGAASDERAARAVELTLGPSVVQSADVAAHRPDSAVVLDVTGWFVGDFTGAAQAVGQAVSAPGERGSASFDGSRSYLEAVKGFDDNISVRSRLTFRPGQPVGLSSVPDGRFVSISMHYTMARLPERPMTPRWGDERVGNFWTVHKDFSQTDSTFFKRMVNRWRLERGERVGDRWRPVEPITFYVDHTVPDAYREWFKEGIENWNVAFEAAGWEGAIRALDLPEGADPDDLQYATLRWNTSDQPGYGAIGPSTVDPRTGEILDADILFEANMFMGFRNEWRYLLNPATTAQAFERALGVGAFEVPENSLSVELPGFEAAMAGQGAVVAAALVARRELDPGEPLPDEILREFTVWVVMHEVGHSLGLQHNFRASASTPLNRLHDTAFTLENGVYNSVMEYPTANLNPDGANGQFYNTGAGSYDRWAISFAYTDAQADADRIAREVADEAHMFGNESGGPSALDPTINVYDLGADPLEWGMQRTGLLRELMDDLPSIALTDNTRYADLVSVFQGTVNEYAQAVAPAVKYLGGQYLNRDRVGDGRMPFENVPRAEQEAALRFIVDAVFAPDALAVDAETLQQFGSDRWTHWGNTSTYQGRLDFGYHEQLVGFQSSVLNQLLNPWRLARIRDGETKYGAGAVITIPELMGELTTAVWSDLGGSISAVRRDLQRAHLDALSRIVVDPAARTPADARAVARWELTQLAERIASTRAAGSGDAYTQAHLLEIEARIGKTLAAEVVEGEG
jgi:hypothetical protein